MPRTPSIASKGLIGAKRRVASGFTSAQWSQIRPEVRQASLFSACVTDAKFLEQIRRVSRGVLAGELSAADGKAALKDWLDRTGYEPEPGEEGTIKDLSSDARLHVIVDTNSKLAEGYGRHMWQSERLKTWPAVEMYRAEQRMEPRNWPLRWRQAGGRLRRGRFVAPFDSDVWTKISAFNHPYPIFDFNSGMWTRMVHRSEAQRLGVSTQAAKRVKPRKLTEGMKTAATKRMGRTLAAAVARNLPGFRLGSDGVLRRAG